MTYNPFVTGSPDQRRVGPEPIRNPNEIIVRLQGEQYVAHFRGPHAAEIVALFGTDTIPTAFTRAAPLERVVDEIKRRNPTTAVSYR